MLVIVPSRGRPENVADLIRAWDAAESTATLLIAVDSDDPRLEDYLAVKEVVHDERVQWTVGMRMRLAGTLNGVAMSRVMRAGTMPHDIIGFMGDDHRPRTTHWDSFVGEAFKDMGHGIVYGNDLLQGPNIPTAVFMTAGMIKALGYMVPPGFVHMYLDNVWKDWGLRTDRLRYLPYVIIEHMHPVAGKAQWDDRYIEVNAGSVYAADAATFETYTRGGLHTDIAKLKELMQNG